MIPNPGTESPDWQVAESPYLNALRQQISASGLAAVERFWRQLPARGYPIVEKIGDDDTSCLVTFLYRAREQMKNVCIVFTDINDRDPGRYQMTRLLNTDLWHITFRTRNDFRNTYRISPDDSLVPLDAVENPARDDAERAELLLARKNRWRCDQLNPHTFRDNPPDEPYSAVALPGAASEPYLADVRQFGVPQGQVQSIALQSKFLGEEREIRIYLPPGYREECGPYPLLIHFDGHIYTEQFPIPVTLDNLIDRREVRPLVAALVCHKSRWADLPCNRAFIEFLAKELAPELRATYALADDPRSVVVAGSSLGGLASAFAAFQYPQTFGNVLSLTGAYRYGPKAAQNDWLPNRFEASDRKPIRFYLTVGRLEKPGHVAVNRRMRDILTAKGYTFRYQEFTGTHTYYSRQGKFADGLSYLIGREQAEHESSI